MRRPVTKPVSGSRAFVISLLATPFEKIWFRSS